MQLPAGASIGLVYWYAEDHIPQDGGGRRVLAWCKALRALGFKVTVVPLINSTAQRQSVSSSALHRLKRQLLPMPFARKLPRECLDYQILVNCVPGTYSDTLTRLKDAGIFLILDWMDLWSSSAESFGLSPSPIWTRTGSKAQAILWRQRERRAFGSRALHAFAGYHDQEAANLSSGSAIDWLPTPVDIPVRSATKTDAPDAFRTVGFVSNFNYPPNRIGFEELIRMFQQIENRPQLIVAGYGSENLTVPSGVVNMGPIDSLETFYSCIDAAVVPINTGGGIKVKAVEALVRGVPVLGTEHVRQGFPPELRHWILPMRSIAEPPNVPHNRFPVELFTQEAFTETLRGALT